MRGLAALAAVMLIGAAAVACGGLSQSDADSRCDQEKQARTACFDDAVYQACVSCFERCGDSCLPQASTCPVQYACPGDPVDGGS